MDPPLLSREFFFAELMTFANVDGTSPGRSLASRALCHRPSMGGQSRSVAVGVHSVCWLLFLCCWSCTQRELLMLLRGFPEDVVRNRHGGSRGLLYDADVQAFSWRSPRVLSPRGIVFFVEVPPPCLYVDSGVIVLRKNINPLPDVHRA